MSEKFALKREKRKDLRRICSNMLRKKAEVDYGLHYIPHEIFQELFVMAR
jgi:hypothetical protein